MARTLRYRRKRGMTRRRGVTKKVRGGRRRLTTTPTLHIRRGPVYPGTVRLRLKRRVGQVTPANIRARKRIRFSRGERENERNGGFFTGQLEKVKFRLGPKRTVHQHLRKLDSRNSGYVIERFGAVNRFTEAGAYGLWTQDNTSVNAYPVYVLALDACAQVTGATPLPQPVFWRGVIDKSVSPQQWNWYTQFGRANDGSASVSTMQSLKSTISNATASVKQNYIAEYSNIKLLFKCASARPGYVKVMLVQFNEEDLAPDDSGAALTANIQNRSKFWMRKAKELSYSPITHEIGPEGRKSDEGMRVLKTWTRNFNPDSSANLANYSGQQIRMDLFLRHNRYCNTQSRQGLNLNTAARVDDDAYLNQTEVGSGTFDRPADPRARMYLVIMGTFYDAPQAAHSVSNCTTFDVEFRGKRIFNDLS